MPMLSLKFLAAALLLVAVAVSTTQDNYIKASDAAPSYEFGNALAVSQDGNVMAVCSKGSAVSGFVDGGALYVFVRTAGVWAQKQLLYASNAATSSWFCESVAVSEDGTTIAVGAIGESSGSTGVGGGQDQTMPGSGAVYVFVSGDLVTWTLQAFVKAFNTAANNQFGFSVALTGAGDLLAVGAPMENGNGTGVGAGMSQSPPVTNSGAVYTYTRSGTVWSTDQYFKAPNAAADNNFGFSVSLSSDGDTLVVGAPFEKGFSQGINQDQTQNSSVSGAVYVFSNTGSWSSQDYIKASNSQNGGKAFGWTVSLSSDETTLVVGDPQESGPGTGIDPAPGVGNTNAGAVYVFSRNGFQQPWSQDAYIKSSLGAAGAQFGSSVSMCNDGSVFAAGADQDSDNSLGVDGSGGTAAGSTTESGEAYLFQNTGSWVELHMIKASNTAATNYFGSAVAISDDASTLAIGAWGEACNSLGINNASQVQDAALYNETGAVYEFGTGLLITTVAETTTSTAAPTTTTKTSTSTTAAPTTTTTKTSTSTTAAPTTTTTKTSTSTTAAPTTTTTKTSTSTTAAPTTTTTTSTVSSTASSSTTPATTATSTTTTVATTAPAVALLVPVGALLNLTGPQQVAANTTVVVLGTLLVQGSLSVVGQLNLGANGSVSVVGGLSITGGVSVGSGSQIVVQGTVSISGGSSLQVTVSQPGVVTVVSQASGGLNGQFSTVKAVASPSAASCTAPVNPPSTMYGSTSLSVTVSFTSTCGGLSTAAIIGIAVGCGVAVLAIAGIVVGLLIYRARERKAMKQLAGKLPVVD